MRCTMTKKKTTTKPRAKGRPPMDPELRKPLDPPRQLGRVPDDVWEVLRDAAKREGKNFTEWALEHLIEAAKKGL